MSGFPLENSLHYRFVSSVTSRQQKLQILNKMIDWVGLFVTLIGVLLTVILVTYIIHLTHTDELFLEFVVFVAKSIRNGVHFLIDAFPTLQVNGGAAAGVPHPGVVGAAEAYEQGLPDVVVQPHP